MGCIQRVAGHDGKVARLVKRANEFDVCGQMTPQELLLDLLRHAAPFEHCHAAYEDSELSRLALTALGALRRCRIGVGLGESDGGRRWQCRCGWRGARHGTANDSLVASKQRLSRRGCAMGPARSDELLEKVVSS